MSRALLLSAVLLSATIGGRAQSPAPDARPIEAGFEQRVRNENWNNLFDYSDQADDQRNQIRYRTRVWANVSLSPNIDIFAGLTQETNQRIGQKQRFDEVIFESLYVDFKRLFTDGLSLRVGRQNLMRGEGFLFMDGTPGDGSRVLYNNAFNLAYARKKSKVELIGILNPHSDRMLPRYHDQHKMLQDWDDQALGFYYTDTNHKKTAFETYYFYKKEVRDRRPVTNPQFQPDRHVQTAGGRVVQNLGKGWSATGELAYQWGAQHPSTRIRAAGGYGYLKKTFTHPWKPYVQAGYWRMSGDDPKTKDRIENWDPLFSRWPSWSELYVYSQLKEVAIGYWTNTSLWQGETGFTPLKPLKVRCTWYHMGASHPFPGDSSIFASGVRRGENAQVRADLTVNGNWRGHVVYERQMAGNFYRDAAHAYFLRFEAIYTLRGGLGAHRAAN